MYNMKKQNDKQLHLLQRNSKKSSSLFKIFHDYKTFWQLFAADERDLFFLILMTVGRQYSFHINKNVAWKKKNFYQFSAHDNPLETYRGHFRSAYSM